MTTNMYTLKISKYWGDAVYQGFLWHSEDQEVPEWAEGFEFPGPITVFLEMRGEGEEEVDPEGFPLEDARDLLSDEDLERYLEDLRQCGLLEEDGTITPGEFRCVGEDSPGNYIFEYRGIQGKYKLVRYSSGELWMRVDVDKKRERLNEFPMEVFMDDSRFVEAIEDYLVNEEE